MAVKPGDLAVITKTKDLCGYIILVSQKIPKQFRYTFSTRIQNHSMDVIAYLYRANDTFVSGEGASKLAKYNFRADFQYKALTELKLLAYFSHLALEQNAITLKQYAHIAKLTTDCENMLKAWIRKDKERFGYAD